MKDGRRKTGPQGEEEAGEVGEDCGNFEEEIVKGSRTG